jgi:hypothetical protein
MLEHLLADYRRNHDQWSLKERTEHEAWMWAQVPEDERQQCDPHHRLGDWLVKTLGGARNDYNLRHFLNRDGTDALWRRLEAKELSLNKAVELFREARKRADVEGTPIATAVAITLDEYEKLPVTRVMDGIPVRAKRPSRLRRNTGAKRKKPRRSKHKDPRVLRTRVRDEVARYAAELHADLDSSTAEQLLGELEVDVNQMLDDHSARVGRAKINAKRRDEQDDALYKSISRRRFNEACRTLNIPIPSPNKPIDLTVAKKAKRNLVRAYHPDLGADNESTRAAYDAVIKAYRLIEQYAEEAKAKGNNN